MAMSNAPAWEVSRMQAIADLRGWSPLVALQIEYSLIAGLGMVTERTLAIAGVVREVAAEAERTPAQVALAWTLRNPGVAAPVIGARTPEQLAGNLGALEIDLAPDQLARLDRVSAIDLGYPHDMLASDHIRTVTAGDLTIETRR